MFATITAAAIAAIVGSHAALSAAPQRVTVRDKPGDPFGNRTRQPDRRDLDIRVVTLTRTTTGKRFLRVVIETAAPLRPDTTVTFRYVDPSGFDDNTATGEISRHGVLVYLNDTTSLSDVASISGKRFTFAFDMGRYRSLDWYPRFRWLVTVASFDSNLGRIRDHVPHQTDAVVAPRFARFP